MSQFEYQGKSLQMADIKTISLDKIVANDKFEVEELLKGCQYPGFFQLDLRGSKLEADLEELYTVSDDYFKQPEEEKMKGFRADIDRGYKNGLYETFEVAREEITNATAGAIPTSLAAHEDLLSRFTVDSHAVTMTLLQSLSNAMGLTGDARLERHHSDSAPNDSGLKIVSLPTVEKVEQMKDNTHTDNGLLTLLWCREWASQIKDPQTGEWGWVEPKDGHVLVNVANYLQTKTDGKLHSCVHRVTQPVDGAGDRYMVSYYLRPNSV